MKNQMETLQEPCLNPAGKIAKKSGGGSFCLIGIQNAMPYIVKNTLLRTAFSEILPAG